MSISPASTLPTLLLISSIIFASACSEDGGGGDEIVDSFSYSLDEDTLLSANLASDFASEGATFSVDANPSLGSATISGDVLTYTPDDNLNGSDEIKIEISEGGEIRTGTLVLSIEAVNDAPEAGGDSLSLNQGVTATVELTGVDLDGDALTFRITQMPANVTVESIDENSGSMSVVAGALAGADSIEFVVNDGTVDSQPATISIVVNAALDIPTVVGEDPPTLLSDTGVFLSPINSLIVSDSIVPYEIVQALWTDWAIKSRYIYVPEGEGIVFNSTEPYYFPVGTFLVKHFEIEISAGVMRNIETRLLIAKQGSSENDVVWEGYSYQWEGDDATLVPDTVDAVIVDGNLSPPGIAIDASAVGGARQQQYEIPSRGQCTICHSSQVGFIRGFRTLNLNLEIEGTNQLVSLEGENLFTAQIPDPSTLSAYSALEDETATLEERVRSYLAVNCAHCHNIGGFCDRGFDMNYSAWDGPTGISQMLSTNRIVPQSPETSQVYTRMNADSSLSPNPSASFRFRMPMIQSNFVQVEASTLMENYINSLSL